MAGQEESVPVSDIEWRLLEPVLHWLRQPVSQLPETFPIARGEGFSLGERFADAFALRLRLFHSLHSPGEAMTKKAFEYAFAFSAIAAGEVATLNPSATTPLSDIAVGGVGFSLKTEASQGIDRSKVTISKLMESLWTKHCSDIGDFINGIHQHVLPRIEHSQRIFVLRAFGRIETNGKIEYELVEIPRDVLLAMRGVKAEEFRPITGAKGTSVPVKYNGTTAYTLVFDGSDQKVTIRGLLLRHCVVHARWTLRAPTGADGGIAQTGG